MKRIIPALFLFAACAAVCSAVIIEFDLEGQAGAGLLPGNETGAVAGTPGSGGEVGAGISFNDATNELTINIGWGSGNGFTDLTGNATAGHIHGPTPSPAPTSYTEATGVLIGLDSLGGWVGSASAGGFSGTVTLSAGQVVNLMAGQLYINIHTAANGGGEIRGQLIAAPIPEPSTCAALLGACALGLVVWRRERLRSTTA